MARPKFGEKGHEGESMAAYSARVRAWNKAKTGEERSERGKKPADETVEEGLPPAAAPVRGSNETQADFHERYRRWQKRSRPREHASPRAEGQRRKFMQDRKKAEPTPSPTPEEEKK